jgi:hypothetical protein
MVRRSPRLTAHGVSALDTSSWVALRWERGNRYYRTHLEQDLWGHWTLTRVVGRKGASRGRYMTSWVGSLENGLTTIGAIAKHRRERGYRLVSSPAI